MFAEICVRLLDREVSCVGFVFVLLYKPEGLPYVRAYRNADSEVAFDLGVEREY